MAMKFTPSYKEKEDERFYYSDGVWIKCSGDLIHSLWMRWASSNNAHRYVDIDGFMITGYHGIPERSRKKDIEKAKDILKAIETQYGKNLSTKSRKRDVVYIRYVFIAKIKEMFPKMRIVDIGNLVNRDHASVVFAKKQYKQLMQYEDFSKGEKTVSSIIENYISNG